jgi:phage shock protein C
VAVYDLELERRLTMLDRLQTRRLYRSRKNAMIAGVAGGIAEYFDIDPILVRVLLCVALAPTGPFALIVYAILAMIIPPAPAGEDQGAVVKQ